MKPDVMMVGTTDHTGCAHEHQGLTLCSACESHARADWCAWRLPDVSAGETVESCSWCERDVIVTRAPEASR